MDDATNASDPQRYGSDVLIQAAERVHADASSIHDKRLLDYVDSIRRYRQVGFPQHRDWIDRYADWIGEFGEWIYDFHVWMEALRQENAVSGEDRDRNWHAYLEILDARRFIEGMRPRS